MVGASGTDQLYGGSNIFEKPMISRSGGNNFPDAFYFDAEDSGQAFERQADTIHDFEASDRILLKGSYGFAGDKMALADGEYGIWHDGENWVVTGNLPDDDGFHDVVVKGANPADNIFFY